MPARQFTQDQIDVALARLQANHGDLRKTAEEMGVSPARLKKWKAEEEKSEAQPISPTPPEAAPEGEGLTLKQRRFVNAYLGQTNGNATEAARVAGYAGDTNVLAVTGHENLRNPRFLAFIQERMAAEAMSANEVLWRLSQDARATLDDVGDSEGEHFTLNLTKAKERGKLHLIKRITYNQWGDASVELVDGHSARRFLAQVHGLTAQPAEKKMEQWVEEFLGLLPDELRTEVERRLEDARSEADDQEDSFS